jgi:hypothetical protein
MKSPLTHATPRGMLVKMRDSPESSLPAGKAGSGYR